MLALGAVACGDDEDEGEEPTATEAVAETPTEAAETPGAAAEPIDITLAEQAGSGVSGSATLTPEDGSFQVEVTVDGGLEEGVHQNHIHDGSCAAQGDIVEPLTDLEAGADGSAEGSTTINEDISHFTEEPHYVAVHDLAGVVVACGDIVAS